MKKPMVLAFRSLLYLPSTQTHLHTHHTHFHSFDFQHKCMCYINMLTLLVKSIFISTLLMKSELSLVMYWDSIAFVFLSFFFFLIWDDNGFFFPLTCLILFHKGVKSLWILLFTSGDLAFPSLVYMFVYYFFVLHHTS